MTSSEKIPRIIHYCWFGRSDKPAVSKKCIGSWAKQLTTYQFIEWNEDNFDISSNNYVKQAYNAKKYAFVSDYVRLYALYYYGGIYMDTDVEVLKPLERFLSHKVFSGFEDGQHVPTGIMGAVKGHPWIKELMNYYSDKDFICSDGSFDMTTNTTVITNYCRKLGLKPNGEFQVLKNDITFYPRTYFCPFDYINGNNYITDDSYTIHHFAKSWLPLHVRLRSKLKISISRILGPGFISKMRELVNG